MLLDSIRTLGGCKNFHCTVFVQKGEQHLITGFDDVEVQTYRREGRRYVRPWHCCPRWDIKPRGDPFLALDVDVLALSDINGLLKFDKLAGVIAHKSPFVGNSFQTWKSLYNICGIQHPPDWYFYRTYKQNFFAARGNCLCPFYINHGVIVMPSEWLTPMKAAVQYVIKKTSHVIGKNYYFPQIVTTLAADMIGVPREPIATKYNNLVFENKTRLQDVVFFHYSGLRNIGSCHALFKACPALKKYRESLLNVSMA